MTTTIIEVQGDLDGGHVPADHDTPLGELLVAWAERYSSIPVEELAIVDCDRGQLLDPADTIIEAGLSFGTLVRLATVAEAAELVGAVELLTVAVPVPTRSQAEPVDVTSWSTAAPRVLPPPPATPPPAWQPTVVAMPPVPSRPPRAS